MNYNPSVSFMMKIPRVLFKSHSTESILNKLNPQIAESIRIWYLYRDKMKIEMNLSDCHFFEPIWFNCNIRLKSKTYFYYPSWYDKGIHCIQDLLCGDRVMEFFELVLDYDISIPDLRKYNFLIKGLPYDWIKQSNNQDPFDLIVDCLVQLKKVPKFAYSILQDKLVAEDLEEKWFYYFNLEEDVDWAVIHTRNFTCTIETQLRSFYFKIFHRAVATNDFLFKINRSDSPLCAFCKLSPETIVHFLIECPVVQDLWKDITEIGNPLDISFFERMFGINQDSCHNQCMNFIFLCTKFDIYRCKFQNQVPSFQALLSFIRLKIKSEYIIAKQNDKLHKHLKKFKFST